MARRTPRPTATVEWVGGIVSMPTTVTGEGEPYRPDMLLWLALADAQIVGATVSRPEELRALAVENLRETIAAPVAGPPGPPTRLRVATGELADVLRPAFPDIDIVVAATPELDTIGASISESIGDADGTDFGWLADGLCADAVGAFEAAWFNGEPVERTLTVATHGGKVDVRVCAPVDEVEPGATRDADTVPERVYRLKIELEQINWGVPDREVSCTVELAGAHTLWDLHRVIQQAFDWDDDHLFKFFVSGKLRDRKCLYVGSPIGDVESFVTDDDDPRSVTETQLDELGLVRRRAMRYLFDEHIVHKITVSTIRDGEPHDAGLPRQVSAVGEAPPQYEYTEE